MRTQYIRFFSIIIILAIYSAFKATQLWPRQIWPALAMILIFFVMLGPSFIYRGKPEVFEKMWFRILAWIGSLTMGVWATFILFSIPTDLVGVFVTPSLGFRWTVAAMSFVFAFVGFFEVARGPRVKEVAISFPDLPAGLQDFKIAQISDLHVGTTIRKGYVDEVVRRTNATDADLIVITGDLVDAHSESIAEHLQPLSGLRARHGVYYITGNHEYYWGVEGLLARLRSMGFISLLNENRVIDIAGGGATLLLAGVTDPAGLHFLPEHIPDLQKATDSAAAVDFKILLAHRPDPYLQAEALGFDLQFSGHTHAGQFFPFSLLIPFAHKYYRGLNRHGRLWIYVNPGTGYWGPANRFTVAPEITLVKLLGRGNS